MVCGELKNTVRRMKQTEQGELAIHRCLSQPKHTPGEDIIVQKVSKLGE